MKQVIIILLICAEAVFAQNIKENFFGFDTPNAFTYCDVNDTSFINKVVRMNPKVLRFPGGAEGNFYHFGKNGYGFDFDEIDKYHGGTFPKRSRGLENSRRKKNQNYDYIDDFIVLVKKTNASVVLSANPFVDNDDIILMIEKLHANNIKVIGVELGSELSNRSYFNKGYTIDDYILFAKSCSDKIKAKFPKIETAIVAAPLGEKIGHRHNVWNNRLAAMNFYDAIIIHSYAKVTKGKDQYGQMLSEETEGKNKSEAFDIYKNRAISFFDEYYPNEVRNYVKIFKKPIWVTEWNLQMSETTGNTLLQSLFAAQYLLELMSNPKLSAIELTTYHNLGGRTISGSIFRNNEEKMEIQSTYYPMMMIGKIFKNKIVKIEQQKSKDIFSYKCYDKYNKEVLSYKIDWGSRQLSCTYNTVGSIKKSMVYKSENLFDKADNLGILDLEFRE